MIGRIEAFNFREIHHQVMLLTEDKENLMIAEKVFPHENGDNALLLYGYIDHETGITFEILCIAKLIPNQALILRDGSPKVSVKIRYDSIHGILANTESNPEYLKYMSKMNMINNNYRADEAAERFREIRSIDPSRHPQYPDDILIWFVSDGQNPEGIWGRVHGHNGRYLTAILLDEPWRNYGYHKGDRVPFDRMPVNDELKAIAIL